MLPMYCKVVFLVFTSKLHCLQTYKHVSVGHSTKLFLNSKFEMWVCTFDLLFNVHFTLQDDNGQCVCLNLVRIRLLIGEKYNSSCSFV